MAATGRPQRILLLNPPFQEPIIRDNYCCFTSKSGYVWPPVDLLYLSGILHDAQTDIYVIDAVADNSTWAHVQKKINQIQPDIIILLTGTVSFNTDIPPLKPFQKKFGLKIYLLGNTPAFQPEYFLKRYPYIHGIFHNFLDEKIKDFILHKDTGCKTVTYRLRGTEKFVRGTINQHKPMEEIRVSHPPLYELFPLSRYSTPFMRNKPMVTALTSFGCPFSCDFCVASALQYQPRAIGDLETEFNSIRKERIKEIFFEDSTFNTSQMEKVCELMVRKKYGFSWSANIHSYRVKRDTLRLMKAAGCHTVQIGVESGNEETLKQYAPSKIKRNIVEAINLCKQEGLKVLGYFIIGFPNETRTMAENTISFSQILDPDYASFSILTPDFGTKLYNIAVDKKLIEPGIFSFDSSGKAILKNDQFNQEEQDKMITKAYRNFYLRPKKILQYLLNIRQFFIYFKNGLSLLTKKLI